MSVPAACLVSSPLQHATNAVSIFSTKTNSNPIRTDGDGMRNGRRQTANGNSLPKDMGLAVCFTALPSVTSLTVEMHEHRLLINRSIINKITHTSDSGGVSGRFRKMAYRAAQSTKKRAGYKMRRHDSPQKPYQSSGQGRRRGYSFPPVISHSSGSVLYVKKDTGNGFRPKSDTRDFV
ncbi:hypothetical protein BDR22DRAFT_824007 [Usnea florida]